jgi:hypothetical protein
MSSKKQTAIEWLEMEIVKLEETYAIPSKIYELCEDAKHMEKEQIIEANEDCSTNELGELFTGEQYYTSTFGS